jgi:invasion protein IalB
LIQINAPMRRKQSVWVPLATSTARHNRTNAMLRHLLYALACCTAVILMPAAAVSQANDKPAGQEFAPRGQRAARTINYSDWSKTCFKTPGTNMVCRTSINGTFETGQSAVRIDLIEREGDKAARLRLFLPVGLYLQAGVKITIDQGTPYQIPYLWCLTNTCVAADLAEPRLLKDLVTGSTLVLELVDSSVLTVSTQLPLKQFAAVRQGPPSRIFEQAIDE